MSGAGDGQGVDYRPREFWQERLSGHFDLRGSGETGLSIAYNRACYTLRAEVLSQALRDQHVDLAGCTVLDVGCGTGFFTAFYLARGARVTGLDIAPVSIETLRARHPEARFLLADVSEPLPLTERFAVVNAMDVLYHITDEARWEAAVTHLADAVAEPGWLVISDAFSAMERLAAHNRMRPFARYRALLNARGLQIAGLHPTHVLLNRHLGPLRFLNRAPGLLLALDRSLLAFGLGRGPDSNKILVARRVSAKP